MIRLAGKKYILPIILICTLFVVFLNEINLNYLNHQFPAKGGMITTADEYSYFQPAKVFFEKGCWSSNENCEPEFIRSPGYGMFFFASLLLNHENPFLVEKILQIICFSISLFLLFKIIIQLTSSLKAGLYGVILFTLIPSFHGFTYYTLTESISPLLLLLSLYLFMNSSTGKNKVGLSLVLGLLLLVRPQLLPFNAVILLYYVFRNMKSIWIPVLSILPLTLWQIRTFHYSNDFSLHPIYSNKNNGEYRFPHKEMTSLFKIWEYRSDRFHQTIGLLSRDTSLQIRSEALKNIPEKYRPELEDVFSKYQLYRSDQRKLSHFTYQTKVKGEDDLISLIKDKKSELKAKYPMDYYLVTPIKSAGRMFLTSMMNLHVFQSPWRENIMIQSIKIVSFLTLMLSLFASLLLIQNKIVNEQFRLFIIASLISVLYLIFIQRLNEERYIVPYMPIWFISLITISVILKKGSYRLPSLSNKK